MSQQGNATKSQSLLNFQNGNRAGDTSSAIGTLHRDKRARTENELPEIIVSDGESSSGNFSSESNTTVVSRNDLCDDEERIKTIRLERLRNKQDRYESHIFFLKECLKIKRIPNGLRLDLEPSIGNNDEDFCAKWYSRLEEFSLTLMNDIVEYSERIKTETTDKIKSEDATLKSAMKPEEYKEVCQVLDQNSTERKRMLSNTKRKKFNYLKFNREGPDNRRSSPNNNRNWNQNRQTREQETDNNHWNQNRQAREEGNNNNQWNQNRQAREEGNNNNQWNHNRPAREEGSRNNQWNQNRQTNNYTDNQWNTHRKQERSGHNNKSTERHSYRDALTDRNTSHTNNLATRDSTTNLVPAKSFEFLSRRSSKTSLYNRKTREENPTSDKQSELENLRKRLTNLESKESSTSPKNEQTPSIGGEKNRATADGPSAEQVLNFISTTMNTLEEFKKHFTTN